MFERSFAQTSYYFRPSIEVKTFVSSTYGLLGNSIFNYSDYLAKNPYFEVNNKVISLRNNLQVGFSLGCNLKNGKQRIEGGWYQDATGSMLEKHFISYDNYNKQFNSYFDNRNYFKSILLTQRFQFHHYIRLTKSLDKNLRIYFNYALGLTYNSSAPNIKKGEVSKIDEYIVSGEGESLTYLDSNISMPLERHLLSAGNRLSGNFSFGFSGDFYTKKNKLLFSMSCFYLQGFKPIERTIHQFFIDDNGKQKRYSYETISKGSGLYLQISRPFTIYRSKITKISI